MKCNIFSFSNHRIRKKISCIYVADGSCLFIENSINLREDLKPLLFVDIQSNGTDLLFQILELEKRLFNA